MPSHRLLIAAFLAATAFASGTVEAGDVRPVPGKDAASGLVAVEGSPGPFLTPSTLQFQAPQFDRIKASDFGPALVAGMAQQRREIDAIANDKAAPTFQNTIVAMERSGQLLTRVSKVFFDLVQSDGNDELEKINRDIAPKLSRHQDAITFDAKLFARIKAVYDQRAKLHLDAESNHLLEKYYAMFVRSGALLDDAAKVRLAGMKNRLAELAGRIQNNTLAATRAAAVVVDDVGELDGLPGEAIADAARNAARNGHPGKWLLQLNNTTAQPVLALLRNRGLRERIYRASTGRADGGPYDNRTLIAEAVQLRAQEAALLGYPDFASYTLDDQMAKTPKAAIDLMTRVIVHAIEKTHVDATRLQAMIDQQQAAAHEPGFTLQPWDWQFYAEQVRKAEYDLDEAQLRPYFELDTVLKDGVFYAAGQLYGLSFRERHDLPAYHSDVRVFEVIDRDDKSIAIIYLDFFERPGKTGGAFMDTLVDQSRLLRQHAVVVNVYNFTRPAPGQPALLSFDEVTSLFSVFGYGLHGMLSDVTYPFFSGTATPRDFVSIPSQFNENWALEPSVFAHYARHYRTGAPMPADLVAKVRKLDTFNQGHETTEYVASALLDLAWHQLPADAPRQDVDAFEAATLTKYGANVAEVPPRYRSTYFLHPWSAGYAAGYYAYLWTAVFAQDAFAWFGEHGGMTRANGQHFRDTVLSRGGSKDAHQLWLDFRGREPSVEPFLRKRGLIPEPAQP